jgi:hypothetical protein
MKKTTAWHAFNKPMFIISLKDSSPLRFELYKPTLELYKPTKALRVPGKNRLALGQHLGYERFHEWESQSSPTSD